MTYLYRQASRNRIVIEFPFEMRDADHRYGLGGLDSGGSSLFGSIRWQSMFNASNRWGPWVDDYWDDTMLIDTATYGSAPSAATSWATVDDINCGDVVRSSYLVPTAGFLSSVTIIYSGKNSDEDGDTLNFVLSKGALSNHSNSNINMAHMHTFTVTGGEDDGGGRAYYYSETWDPGESTVAANDLLMLTCVRSSVVPSGYNTTDSDMMGAMFLTIELKT